MTQRQPRILVVEDQDDVRRMLATALEMEGHVVDEAATATEGLKCLQESKYDLVLTDYAMPGGTGTWMLQVASQRGLMTGTIALIVTAHPDVRDVDNVEVITKPLDLDKFLETVRHVLATGTRTTDVLFIEPGGLQKLTPEEAEQAEARRRRRYRRD